VIRKIDILRGLKVMLRLEPAELAVQTCYEGRIPRVGSEINIYGRRYGEQKSLNINKYNKMAGRRV